MVSDSIRSDVPVGHVLLTIDGQDWTNVPGDEETVVAKFKTASLPMRMVFAYPKPDAALLFRRGDYSPRSRTDSETVARYRSDSATSVRGDRRRHSYTHTEENYKKEIAGATIEKRNPNPNATEKNMDIGAKGATAPRSGIPTPGINLRPREQAGARILEPQQPVQAQADVETQARQLSRPPPYPDLQQDDTDPHASPEERALVAFYRSVDQPEKIANAKTILRE